MKRIRSVFITVLMAMLLQWQAGFAQQTDRKSFYAALSSADLATINQELAVVGKGDPTVQLAFEGALMMKKAGLLKGPGKKLQEFKAGKEKLETALQADPNNTEFRFLRLMIQENAPKILGYYKDLEQDHEHLRKNFKSLSSPVQQTVLNYTKKSKILKSTDF
ncbi:MAG: hypothetical protein ACTHMM_19230 [Agriterribacter sp.]